MKTLEIKSLNSLNCVIRIRARTCNAKTGLPDRVWTKWKNNLVFDVALKSFANSSGATSPAAVFTFCQVGTSAASNSFPSGSITFTQSGTTITASSTFFTAAMVGALIKYGTGSGGAEQYIVSQTGTACVVSGAGMTVGSPIVATVWLVQATALVAKLAETNTYQTTGSSCGTVISANISTMQRTFNFAVQGSPYNANEIGYNRVSASSTFGRIVLPSTIVVSTSQFLQVQMQLIMTCSPSAPTAVGNVGTGVNTAGNAMLECMPWASVASNGTVSAGTGTIDGASGNTMSNILRIGSTVTQNSSPSSGTAGLSFGTLGTNYLISVTVVNWIFTTGSVGLCTASFAAATFATTGQTMFAIGITNTATSGSAVFDLVFTSSIVLPTGTYQPQFIFQLAYTRTLVN